VTEEHGVAGPGIAIEGIESDGQTGTNRVEVDVADQLEQVGFLFDEDVFEAVLEKLARSAMAAVESGSVGTEPAPGQGEERECSGTKGDVGMGGHQGPGVDGRARIDDGLGQPSEKRAAIAIGAKQGPTFDTANDDVVESTGIVEPRAARH
jgi:hypothetical protein